MKLRFLTILLLLAASLFFVACGSTPKAENNSQVEDEVETVEEDIDIVEDLEDDIIFDDDDDVISVDEEVVTIDDDDEYIRSTTELAPEELVTREEFSDDKATILEIIDELHDVMEKGDVNAWLTYLDPDSIRYYSSPANIRKAQKKLPNKTIQLNGIGDYFKFVFIPARKRSQVKEIRYISKNEIKAVDVKDDGSVVVYYQFVKKNNKWLVHIPTL